MLVIKISLRKMQETLKPPEPVETNRSTLTGIYTGDCGYTQFFRYVADRTLYRLVESLHVSKSRRVQAGLVSRLADNAWAIVVGHHITRCTPSQADD